ncbi:hypothetical protein [Paenibacillus herberti]|uniref:hypothetical protein n=1 Tax=Paenibacillus herberti TaxID=1619309 RepID=UPI0011316F1D|nr:hypothetical protein [Paenibacillus herberti]
MNGQFETMNGKRTSIGIILVLFILLVIVASVFCSPKIQYPPSGQPDDGSSSITSSQRFTINNLTSNYWFSPVSFTGDGFENGPPVMRLIPPEGIYGFEILVSASQVYSPSVVYNIIRRDGSTAGTFETTMFTNGPFFVTFMNTSITGPFIQNTARTTLSVSSS